MSHNTLYSLLVAILGLLPQLAEADSCKVLAVMSYRESFYYTREIQEGLEQGLGGRCEISYAYLDVLSQKEAVPIVLNAFGKPAFSAWKGLVHIGVLCTVIERGQEQGALAAEMLLKVMEETPISDLPVTRSKKGKRVLNVTTMKSLNITPKPIILKGIEIVQTAQ